MSTLLQAVNIRKEIATMVMQARCESVLKTLGFSTGIALQRSLQEVTSQKMAGLCSRVQGSWR